MANQLEPWHPSDHPPMFWGSARGRVLLAVASGRSAISTTELPPCLQALDLGMGGAVWDMVASGEDVEEEQQWIRQLVLGGQ